MKDSIKVCLGPIVKYSKMNGNDGFYTSDVENNQTM